MASVRIIYTIFLVYLSNSYGDTNFINDYCWKDYDGILPVDAFKAGEDKFGQPIYIGQTLFENKLIPGKIHSGSKEIHIEFAKAYTINETIKILSTSFPERFQWKKVNYEDILSLKPEHHIFEGGYEKGYTTYVGRAFSHGEMTVGKVICFDIGCYKLTTIESGRWYDHGNFELLLFDPDAKSPNKAPEPTKSSVVDLSAAATEKSVREEHTSDYNTYKPSFLTYFLLILVVAALIALVVVLVRRC